MYHSIVKSKLQAAFAGLNAGRIEAITDLLATDADHTFIGSHALSGTRRTPEAIHCWYERLLRLLPDISFTLREIDVQGPPWHTLATVEWTETNSGTDGVRTSADGVNVIRIRWGKVTSVHIYTDTVKLVGTLDRIATQGTLEAHAAPITS